MANENPFVTAFVLMLKWSNFGSPEGASNMFRMYQTQSRTLHMQNYQQDIRMDPNPSPHGNKDHLVYDFIIVGGGTAGCIVAMRLCEKFKVLVLEAGAEPTYLAKTPLYSIFQWTSESTDWGMHSQPQSEACISCKKKKIKFVRGKALGGSMTVGHSVYSRGHPKDYDNWATLTGDDEWKFVNMIQWFKKTENYKGKFEDSENHGFDGKMKVMDQRFQPIERQWVDAGAELNMNVTDPNESQVPTFAPIEVTIHEGKKENVYDEILRKELWRKTLKITRYATVEKVLFDSRHAAKGVIYHRNGETIEVRAKKEVILAAGVFNTPKILMLSGVGPEEHLRDMSIKIKKIVEMVGKNLVDQPSTVYGPCEIIPDKSFVPARNLTYSVSLEYQVNASGPLSWNYMSGVAYYTSPKSNDPDWPNIQLTLVPVGIDDDTHHFIDTAFDFKKDYMQKYLKDSRDNDAFWIVVTLGRPTSNGTVKLKSKDYFDELKIQPKYFNTQDDVDNIVEGMKFADRVVETAGFNKLDARLVKKMLPGCERLEVKSADYYECFARHITFSLGNTFGTCRMGKTAEDSVVNSKLLVHKVKRLRIVDASVIPNINSYSNAAVMAVAEKASEMLKYKWEYEQGRSRDDDDEGDAK